MRIVSWNIENLAPWLAGGSRDLVAQWRALGEPDVLCLQEVRVRAGDAPLVDAMEHALPGFRCFHSLNRDARNASFRGGRAYGVATYVRSGLRARHVPLAWDLEGRICATILAARRLAIVNVYAVNGTARPHWDHDAMRIAGDRHAFKQAFIERLRRELQGAPFAALAMILIGDWNVSRERIDATPRLRTEEPHATARRRFNEELMPSLDLVDVFRERNPDARAYTWINGRSRRLDAARVDYALVSRRLLARVADATIEADPALRPGSDHAPIAIELATRRDDRARNTVRLRHGRIHQ
ncbi:MAG TPA: exodeoxyribonuclease III [Rhodanobacteraceae bacterium]|nr:exodeoxyribonuclease III [Rhodanobacteraceae bacterium]